MFDKFQDAVREAYKELKANGKLHFDREQPSPGELKRWCLHRYMEGINREDQVVYTAFFMCNNADELANSIARYDRDKFRPLRNFIIGETNQPDENIVKLLAILIDFKPRPYNAVDWAENDQKKKDLPLTEKTRAEKLEEDTQEPSSHNTQDLEEIPSLPDAVKNFDDQNTGINQIQEQEKTNIPKPPTSTKPKKKIIYAILGSLVGLSCITYFSQDKQCMCWVKDQYVKVSCQDQANRLNVIALQEERLTHFKKILRPDTLTLNDVNQVWYSKINNEVEFFTAPGMHPVHEHRSLKSATKHIIETYAGEQP